MTKDEILSLINAGYSKEDIEALGDGAQDPENGNGSGEDPDTSVQEDIRTRLGTLEKSITKLITTLQAGNARSAGAGAAESVDDILANFINPKKGE